MALDSIASPKPAAYMPHAPVYMVTENAVVPPHPIKADSVPPTPLCSDSLTFPISPPQGDPESLKVKSTHILTIFHLKFRAKVCALGTKERMLWLISSKVKAQSRGEMRKTSPEAAPSPINDKCCTLVSGSQDYKSHK